MCVVTDLQKSSSSAAVPISAGMDADGLIKSENTDAGNSDDLKGMEWLDKLKKEMGLDDGPDYWRQYKKDWDRRCKASGKTPLEFFLYR